jgi:hypothetical protein
MKTFLFLSFKGCISIIVGVRVQSTASERKTLGLYFRKNVLRFRWNLIQALWNLKIRKKK